MPYPTRDRPSEIYMQSVSYARSSNLYLLNHEVVYRTCPRLPASTNWNSNFVPPSTTVILMLIQRGCHSAFQIWAFACNTVQYLKPPAFRDGYANIRTGEPHSRFPAVKIPWIRNGNSISMCDSAKNTERSREVCKMPGEVYARLALISIAGLPVNPRKSIYITDIFHVIFGPTIQRCF